MAPVEPSAGCQTIQVEVVFSPEPRQIQSSSLELPLGSKVRDALKGAGLLDLVQGQGLGLGTWGRRATLDQVLQPRDRVEVYRGLIVDPKEARRVRYRAQGAKLRKGQPRPKSGPEGNSSN